LTPSANLSAREKASVASSSLYQNLHSKKSGAFYRAAQKSELSTGGFFTKTFHSRLRSIPDLTAASSIQKVKADEAPSLPGNATTGNRIMPIEGGPLQQLLNTYIFTPTNRALS